MRASKKKALSLGAAGITALALLAGTITTANWSDSIDLRGGQITSGNLDIEKISNLNWYERSEGSANLDGLINLDNYRIVPGDEIQGIQDLDVALEGNNILAEFEISTPELSGDLFDSTHGVVVTYRLIDENGTDVIPYTFYGLENAPFYVKPEDVTVAVDGNMDYQLIIDATFDEDTPAQVRTQVQGELKKITATIRQVREESPSQTPGGDAPTSGMPEIQNITAPGPIFDAPVENGPIELPDPQNPPPNVEAETYYQVFNHATEFTADGKMLIAGGQYKVTAPDWSPHLRKTLLEYTNDGNGNMTVAYKKSLPRELSEIEMTRGQDGKIYLPGGGEMPQGVNLRPESSSRTYSSDLLIYTPETNSWTYGEDMPEPRKSMGVTTGNDGKIYAIGGYYYGYRGDVFIYDPATGLWNEGTKMPTRKGCNNAVTAPNGKIYCYSNEKVDTHMYIYDPSTDSWDRSTIAPKWFGDVNMTSIVGDYVIIAGGQYYDVNLGFVIGQESTSFLIYNTTTDQWGYTDRVMSTPKYGFGLTETGNDMTVYLNGGYDMDLRIHSDVEAFDFSNINFTPYPYEIPESDFFTNPIITDRNNISVGANHSCIIKNGGEVWCAGKNDFGQLGNGTTTDSTTYTKVSSINNALTIDVGKNYTFAITADGELWGWGFNGAYSLGVGDNQNKLEPVKIMRGAKDVSAGFGSASGVLLGNGTLEVAGHNTAVGYGRESYGYIENFESPPPGGWKGLNDISIGNQGAYVLKEDGSVWGTGINHANSLNNISRSIGSVSYTSYGHWIQIGEFNDIEEIYDARDCGAAYRRSNGEVWGWGGDSIGVLGLGNTTSSRSLTRLEHFEGAKKLSFDNHNTFMIKNDNTLWVTGWNNNGQFGNGYKSVYTKVDRPRLINSIDDVVDITSHYGAVIATKSDGTKYAWGDNEFGKLGVGSTESNILTPQPVIE